MTYGRQPLVNKEINWVTDEDGNVIGNRSPDGRSVLSLVSGAGKSASMKKQIVGRFKTLALGGSDHTTSLQFDVEANAYALRVWIPNLAGVTIPNVKVCVGPQNQIASGINTTGGFINATFSGASSATLPAGGTAGGFPSAETPSWTPTDVIMCPGVARVDSGTRQLFTVRVEVPSASTTITIPFNGFTGWTDGVSAGGRLFIRRAQAVLGVTTTGNFTNTAVENTNFIPCMVEYFLSDGNGTQVLIVGDSTREGAPNATAAALYYASDQRACYELSTPAKPIEFFCAAQHGQTALVYTQYAASVAGMVAPNVVIASPYSINSFSTNISNGTLQQFRGVAGWQAKLASDARGALIVTTGLPVNPAFKTYTTDQSRRDLNAELIGKAAPASMRYVSDVAGTSFSGAADGNGQTNITVAAPALVNADGAHPTDAGNDVLKVPTKAILSALLGQ